jgi:hypothetical protein
MRHAWQISKRSPRAQFMNAAIDNGLTFAIGNELDGRKHECGTIHEI